jgi:hypothetical protein
MSFVSYREGDPDRQNPPVVSMTRAALDVSDVRQLADGVIETRRQDTLVELSPSWRNRPTSIKLKLPLTRR